MNDLACRFRPCLVIALLLGGGFPSPSAAEAKEWTCLFNGQNLDGWVAHLGHRGQESSQSIDQMFTINDGLLHVYRGAANRTWQYSGNLRTQKRFSRFHLQVEYRWLEARFIPRHAAVRDAGIMFHIHGHPGEVWPPSIEMQLGGGQPGDPYVTGDVWVLGPTRASSPSRDQTYAPKGALTIFGDQDDENEDMKRVNYTSVEASKPHGEWNLAEIIVHGSRMAQYYLNGQLVNVVRDLQYRDAEGHWQPLESGHISLQAEWAELQYRNVRLKEL